MKVGVLCLRVIFIVLMPVYIIACAPSTAEYLDAYQKQRDKKYKPVQGTAKFTLDQSRMDVEDVQFPVNFENMRQVRAFDNDAYKLVRSHFYKKGQNLKVSAHCSIRREITPKENKSSAKTYTDIVSSSVAHMDPSDLSGVVLGLNTEATSKRNYDESEWITMVSPYGISLSAAIIDPGGKTLKQYDFDTTITMTYSRHVYDKESPSISHYINKQVSTLYHNCYASLINQMADDLEQIDEWDALYPKHSK